MKKPKKEKPVSECLKELNAHTQQLELDDVINTELNSLWDCLEDVISENESLKDKIL